MQSHKNIVYAFNFFFLNKDKLILTILSLFSPVTSYKTTKILYKLHQRHNNNNNNNNNKIIIKQQFKNSALASDTITQA